MKFSGELMKILSWASDEAQRTGWNNICPDHLMLAIIRHSRNEACRVLSGMGVDLQELKNHLDGALFRKDAIPYGESTEIRPNDKTLSCLNMAAFETSRRHELTTTTADLLISISGTPGCLSSGFLNAAGAGCQRLRQELGQDGTADGSDNPQGDYTAQMAIAMSAELVRLLSASDDVTTNAVWPNS